MDVESCRPIELPVVSDRQGNLAFAEAESHVPFRIARVFYVYEIPVGGKRGGHAHISLQQAIFCVAGRLEIVVDEGRSRSVHRLEDPHRGLYLPPMVWHEIAGFSPNTVYVVLASAAFDERDYIRDHDEFLAATAASS